MSSHKLCDIHRDTSLSDRKHQNTCSSGNITYVSIRKVQVGLIYMKEGDGKVLITFSWSFMFQALIQRLFLSYFYSLPFLNENSMMFFKLLYCLFNLNQCEPIIMIYYLPVYLLYLFVASPPMTFYFQFPCLKFFSQMSPRLFFSFNSYLDEFPFRRCAFLHVYHLMLFAFIKMKSCPSRQCRILFQGCHESMEKTLQWKTLLSTSWHYHDWHSLLSWGCCHLMNDMYFGNVFSPPNQ